MATFRRHICDGHIVCDDVFNYYHDVVTQIDFCVQNPLCSRAKNTRTNEDVAYMKYCPTQRLSYTSSARKKAYYKL